MDMPVLWKSSNSREHGVEALDQVVCHPSTGRQMIEALFAEPRFQPRPWQWPPSTHKTAAIGDRKVVPVNENRHQLSSYFFAYLGNGGYDRHISSFNALIDDAFRSEERRVGK